MKFPQMSKSEILALAREVSTSLQTIGTAEVNRLAKGEGSSYSSTSSSSGSPEASLGKGSIPAEGSSSSASSGAPEGSASAMPPPGGEGSSGSSGSEGSASAMPPGADGGAPPPGMDGSAPPPGMDGSAPPGGAPPPGAPPMGGEGAPPAGPTMEELVGLYMALPDQDFEVHAAAFQQAAAQRQGGALGPPGGAPPPGMSPSAPPGSPPPMGKQEVKTATTTGPVMGLEPGHDTPAHVDTANPNIGPKGTMSKTDPYTAAAQKSEEPGTVGERLAKAEEAVGALVKVVDVLTAPIRKAITGDTALVRVPYQGKLGKSEAPVGTPLKKSIGDMTRDEVHEALKRVCATPKLTKAERAIVNEFYLHTGDVKLADLEVIINKA